MTRLIHVMLAFLFSVAFSTALHAGESFWIDVRGAEEVEKDHVSLAVNIPYDEITARIGEVTEDRDAEIYLYCRSGRRADIALEALEEMGYSRVVNLDSLENARHKAADLNED